MKRLATSAGFQIITGAFSGSRVFAPRLFSGKTRREDSWSGDIRTMSRK